MRQQKDYKNNSQNPLMVVFYYAKRGEFFLLTVLMNVLNDSVHFLFCLYKPKQVTVTGKS